MLTYDVVWHQIFASYFGLGISLVNFIILICLFLAEGKRRQREYRIDTEVGPMLKRADAVLPEINLIPAEKLNYIEEGLKKND